MRTLLLLLRFVEQLAVIIQFHEGSALEPINSKATLNPQPQAQAEGA